jgi:hypothetical protein
MADRLEIYKGALRLLGDAHGLSSLTEVGPARSALDDAWQPAVRYMLAKGLWNFAIRTVELSNDEDVEARFGYEYSFSKPTDWIRTVSICSDATFRVGYELYEDEAQYWYADIDPLYIRYVSDDDDYGWNIAAWREPFAAALSAYLAFSCGLPISSDKSNRNDMHSLFKGLLKDAKALDAVDERVRQKPDGRLVRSRTTSRNRYQP